MTRLTLVRPTFVLGCLMAGCCAAALGAAIAQPGQLLRSYSQNQAQQITNPNLDERAATQERVQRMVDIAKKNPAVHLTAVDDAGRPYSQAAGYVDRFPSSLKYLLFLFLVLASLLTYFLFTWSSTKSDTVGPKGKPVTTGDAHTAAQEHVDALDDHLPKVSIHIRPADLRPITATHSPTWSELVRAAGGDPVRAASIIAGEVALDPTLPPDSDEALARAWHRLLPRLSVGQKPQRPS